MASELNSDLSVLISCGGGRGRFVFDHFNTRLRLNYISPTDTY